ncbi:MAG: hypothetical protein L0Y71_22905 [Gemmataceae bacterium]|nr:hypothetical protein [Gemmataceae bacterium]
MFSLDAWQRSSSRKTHSTRGASGRTQPRRHRPQLEILEDRVVPAFNLAISTDPTVGVTLANGVFTATASGANINVAAIQFQLDIGNNVTVTLQSQVSAITTLNQTYTAQGDLIVGAVVSGAGQGFTFTDANDLTIGTVSGTVGITTSGGPIDVTTTAGPLTVSQNVSAGAATIELTAGGGESTFANSAVVSNSAGNTIRIEANRMALNGAPGTSAITAAGGGRVELDATLANRPIDLGAVSDPISVLSLSDAELDTIATTGVLEIGDGNEGNVSVSAAVGPNNVPTLTIDTGGGITGAGAIIVSNLRLSANAAVSLTGSNSVGTLAADVANSGAGFTFQNNGALTIGTVDTVAGITTNNGPIVVNTTTGGLTVASPIAADSANITLTAGTAVFNSGAVVTAVNGTIVVNAAAATTLNGAATLQVTGAGNITLTTDDLTVAAAATISASDGVANANNVVTIGNFTAGRAISLGSDANLGLTDAELDRVRAETLIVGRNDAAAAGAITLSGQIDLTAGANTVPTLHLRTGSGVVDGTLTEQADLRAAALAIEAAAGIGAADDLDLAVSMLAASNGGAGAAGDIQLSNTGVLTVATVDGITGVQRTGGGLGDVIIAASLGLTINAPVLNSTGGDVALTADAPNSGNAAAILTVSAAVTAAGGNGDVALNGNTLVQNSAAISATGAGDITANFGGAATFNNGATRSTLDGLIDLTAADAITLNGNASITTARAGNIRLTTDDVAIAGTASIGASTVVTIRNFTPGRAINLGTNTALGLTEAELDRIGAATLIIGRNDGSAAGDITVSAAVDLSRGANVIPLLQLMTGGSVLQSASGLVTVGAVAVAAGGGIGAVATPLQTAAGAFAASVGAGVFLSNAGALTIGSVAGIDGVTATSGAITISNIGAGGAGAFTVIENVQTPGDITLTARESIPARPGDNLSINAGVTINSSAGAVGLQVGDSLTLSAGAAVQATGAVTLVGGFADDGNGGVVNFFGSATGAAVSVQGDSKKEANESFYLDLFGNSGNSLFTKNRGLGTILNDD